MGSGEERDTIASVVGGREAGRGGDGESQEQARGGPSFHADQHGQPGFNMEISRSTLRCYQINGGLRPSSAASPRFSPSRYSFISGYCKTME